MSGAIPNYELFGELLAGSYTDPVHHETIRERSSRYDWTIRLHRHTGLAQVFLFRTPGVDVQLGDLQITSTEALVLLAPPGVPHGFRFSEDVVGDVLSLRIGALDPETSARIEQFAGATGRVFPESTTPHFAQVAVLMDQLRAVYHSLGPERPALLRTLTQLVVTYLSADQKQSHQIGSAGTAPERTRHEAQAERFCALIERNFQSAWSVGDYAKALAVSTPHLTRVCKKILGHAPNALVRQRRLLEAKRLLEYTRLPIAEVAHKSGYRDPAFFSRTFKRDVGLTPLAYRLQSD